MDHKTTFQVVSSCKITTLAAHAFIYIYILLLVWEMTAFNKSENGAAAKYIAILKLLGRIVVHALH
jgi:hypothetical protein